MLNHENMFKLRYVPAMDVQIRSRVLISMPVEMQDHVLEQYSPKTPPAAGESTILLAYPSPSKTFYFYFRLPSAPALSAVKQFDPWLKNPHVAPHNPVLRRYMSVPVQDKNRVETLQQEEESTTTFKFPRAEL